jgi:hypothetical protein
VSSPGWHNRRQHPPRGGFTWRQQYGGQRARRIAFGIGAQLSASGGSAAARVVRVRGDRIFCARFLANSTFLARPPAQGDQAGAGPGPSALAPTDGPHPSSPNTGSDQPGAGSTVAPNSVAAPMTSTTEQVATRLATRLQHGIRKPRIYIDGTVK